MLRSAITGSGPSGPPQQNVAEIINLLESSNISVIEETTILVRDSLSSASEPWLLNGLVDYYVTSGNVLIRRLLTGIRQPQHKHLLAKLEEYLQKSSTRHVALNLFGHIIRKDPSWIHQIIQSRAYGTVIKCLQLDNDVAALTVAMYVLSTLLPKVPTQVGGSLNHLFGIYVRLVSWKIIRGVETSDLNATNFDTALYSFFLCLYGMYPCSFLDYLQQYYRKTRAENAKTTDVQIQPPATTPGEEQVLMEKKRHDIFETRVLPMLQRVRLHPNLILYTKELEVLNEKWRKTESHDIVVEISQIPIEEACQPCSAGLVTPKQTQIVIHETDVASSSTNSRTVDGTTPSAADSPSEMMTIWSPSMEIGLSTPPPSRGMSPTRDISDDKSRRGSGEGSSKSKLRPSTLTLSHSSMHGGNVSTPCTPTMPSLSYDCEKSEYDNGLLMSEPVSCESSLPGGNPTNEKVTSSNSSDEFGCTSRALPLETHTVSSAEGSTITDFSPALQPSADHLSVTKLAEGTTKSFKDSLFLGTEKPSVKDILESANSDLSRTMSSSELLEKEIQFSIESGTERPKTDIDWLHFGHGALNEKDSQALVAGYLQMRCALLYERHCRQQHATKARRLMRKIYESSALEERNKSLKDMLIQKENETAQLQLMVKTLKAELSKQEKTHQDALDSLRRDASELSKMLKATREENVQLKLEKSKDADALKSALEAGNHSQSELYKCQLQLEAQSKNKETNQDLRSQIVQLQKQMLIVEELSRKTEVLYQNEMKFKAAKTAEYDMLIQSYKMENTKLQEQLRQATVVKEFMTGKAKEMEKMVEKKNMLIDEQKKYLENVKSLARSQIQAMESKYQAQKSIAARMEVQIMELYAKLTALEGQLDSGEFLSHLGSKPIHQPSSHGAQYRYGHLLEATPELSPPIRLGMLEESTVPTSELEASTGTE